jgi:GDPmannose 4,6-dehydratase
MIAHYVKKLYNNESVYGINHNNDKKTDIIRYNFDLKDMIKLEECITSINPDYIIHLGGISSSKYAYENPLKTIEINGMVTVNICDIIYKHNLKCKLFNASSSEIYKGHTNYQVKEDDTNMYHLHPYSIAKIMGHNMIKFYRENYKLPFSNGILFTIESEIKRKEFLLNKIAEHIRNWGKYKKPLELGSLDSYRMILHADDAANAIFKILEQNSGDDYIICGKDNNKIYDLVIKMYELKNINLEKKNNKLIEKETGLEVININDYYIGNDTQIINITGIPHKLYNLGWTPKYDINNIISSLIG